MKQLNKFFYKFILTACLVFAVAFMLKTNILQAEAAAEYKSLWKITQDSSGIMKSGNYYFKYNSSMTGIIMSTSRYGVYTETPLPVLGSVFTNGTQAYYIRDNILYQYEYATGKVTVLKKPKVSGDAKYAISTIYKTNIYITKSSFEKEKYWIYRYNVKTKKWQPTKSNSSVCERYKNYVVVQQGFRTDISPYPIILYKIKKSGAFSKVKTLSKSGIYYNLEKKKIYYATYSNYMKKATLYRCNVDGSNRKKIKTISTTKKTAYVFFTKVTSKYCEYNIDGKQSRYTYPVKKTKK